MRMHSQPFAGRRLKLPFDLDELLIHRAGDDGAFDYERELPKGSYDLILCSSSGNGSVYFDGIWFWGAGGSGAAWEGKFNNPRKQIIKIHVGKGKSEQAFLELGGVRMITLTGGNDGNVVGTVPGGTVTVNPSLEIVKTRVAASTPGKTGNGYTGIPSAISPCTIRPWGDCVGNGTSHIQHNGGTRTVFKGKLDKIGGGGERLTALVYKAFKAFKSATSGVLDKLLFRQLLGGCHA